MKYLHLDYFLFALRTQLNWTLNITLANEIENFSIGMYLQRGV